MPEPTHRRLAAIVAADVVGYSRMMSADEVATLAALRAHRAQVVDPLIAAHAGRLVKTMGDGLLLEFASVVAAVEFAVAMQAQTVERAATVNASEAIHFRIGIHVGDVIVDGDDIFGDGVNIAARVEPLAGEDGIAITDDAYRQVRDRVDVAWFDGGERTLKNITHPVRVWHWEAGDAREPRAAPGAAAGAATKPSIAVLPFTNMSGDPDQEFFAQGMTEDLITDLSKLSGLFVVSRSTSSVFAGQRIDVRDVAGRLGVRYVLEGSVRKAGQRVRINVQLTDREQPGQLWAERYDGSIDNVFELQDDVGARVVSALSVTLRADEGARLRRVHTQNLEAYELYVQAKAAPYPPVPDRIRAASEMFEQVIAMDPDFAGGHAGLAVMLGLTGILGFGELDALAVRTNELAATAVGADDSFGWAHVARSLGLLMVGRHEEAVAAGHDAIERQPNDADAHAYMGMTLAITGRPADAIAPIATAIELNPRFINGPYLNLLALARFLDGQYEPSIDAFEANVERGGPVGPPALAWGAGACQALGRTERAVQLVSRALTAMPSFALSRWNLLSLLANEEQRSRAAAHMRAAGLPD